MPHPDTPPGPGLKTSASRVADSAMALVRTRLELASVELAEERERLLLRLVMLIAGILLLLFGVLGLGVLLVVIFWDTHRLLAVLLPALLCLGAGAWLLRRSRAVRRPGEAPFAATMAELDKDRAAIAALLSPAPPPEHAAP